MMSPVQGRIALLSHAATAATRAARFARDEAVEPAALARLDARPPPVPAHDRCLAGPSRAAAETAAALGLAPALDGALADLDPGDWAGLTLPAVEARDPQGLAAWLGDPAATPHGGESLLGLLERVRLWLDAQAESGGRVLAITHAAVLRAALMQALHAPPAAFWRIDAAPLSWLVLSGRGGRWTVQRLGPA